MHQNRIQAAGPGISWRLAVSGQSCRHQFFPMAFGGSQPLFIHAPDLMQRTDIRSSVVHHKPPCWSHCTQCALKVKKRIQERTWCLARARAAFDAPAPTRADSRVSSTVLLS